MTQRTPKVPADRIVVIMPNWLGDGVMATPFLRALRNLYPAAHIHAIARPLVAPVLAGLPFINDFHIQKKGEEHATASHLKQLHADLGITLPNSIRSAWTLFRAGIPRRLGYKREWRSLLLTDRLPPIKRTPQQIAFDRLKEKAIEDISNHTQHPTVGSDYQPIPTIDYYLQLAAYLGADTTNRRMELAITDAERTEAELALAQIENQKSKIKNLITLVPGANFGSSKCWLPERFAALATRLITDRNATILIASSPAELPIVDAILKHAQDSGLKTQDSLIPLAKLNDGKGLSLGALKELVRRAGLMICNDTGPRHFAAALGTPVVTLFGPTDPTWAETFYEKERQVRIDVPCGPCQLKKCPIDHRCMRGIEVQEVLNATTLVSNLVSKT